MVIYKAQAEGFTRGYNLEIWKKITFTQHKNETLYVKKMEISSRIDAEKYPKREGDVSSSIIFVSIHTQPLDRFERYKFQRKWLDLFEAKIKIIHHLKGPRFQNAIYKHISCL